MEYVFGTIKRKGRYTDILKTVGDEHTDLTDKHTVVREYSDSVITDTFYVTDHYQSKDGEDGKCYDWYEINEHYRYIDYFTPQKESLMPYTDTKQAYIGDIEVSFSNVPAGNLTVYVSDEEGNYPGYTVSRNYNTITVQFEPLEYVTTVTISIAKEN